MALLEEVQAASRRDDGCLHYGYYTEITDPLSFIAVEEWRDEEALAAHLRQPHVARLIAALPELGETPRDSGARSGRQRPAAAAGVDHSTEHVTRARRTRWLTNWLANEMLRGV